jgi:uncharacterized protein
MKRLLLFGLLLLSQLSWSQDIPAPPNPPRPVNDFAHVLTDDQYQTLDRKLRAYNDSTSSQIVIVTVDNTGDYPPEDFALKILRDWGVGSKKNNNGIVILAAISTHKLRIEVGDGLEGAIPDIIAKQIITNEIAPNFRQNNYYRGFDRAVDAIIKAAAGEYKADARPQGRGRGTGNRGGSIIGLVVLGIIILFVLSSIGRGGGGGGGTINRGGFLPWLILGSMLNNRGGSGGWGGGDGGGWSGGGGGGGGGFDFGGGSGSGGGASGSW